MYIYMYIYIYAVFTFTAFVCLQPKMNSEGQSKKHVETEKIGDIHPFQNRCGGYEETLKDSRQRNLWEVAEV